MSESYPDKGKMSGRERIIQAACELGKQHTFDDITIDEIVKCADLSRPAFYYHFSGGKEELRAALVQRGLLSEAPAQDTRQMILDAALRVFGRAGVTGTTLEDIATEAGVSRGALSWHFHSKDDLVAAIIQHKGIYPTLRKAVQDVEQILRDGGPMDDEALFRLIAGAFYDAFVSQGDLTRLPFLLLYTHPNAAQHLSNKILHERKCFTEYIQKRQAEGAFRSDLDASYVVHIMAMAFIMRGIGYGLYDHMPFAQFSREEIIHQIVTLLLCGLTQRNQANEQIPAHQEGAELS